MIGSLWRCFWGYVKINIPKFTWVFAFAPVFWFFYGALRKKGYTKQHENSRREALCRGLLCFSCSLIFVMTLFGRTSGGGGFRLAPFVSYRMALSENNVELLLQILANIAMYVPIGGFLPYCFKIFEKGRYTLLAVLCCSVSIELLQGLLSIGLFETDDIFGNVLGATIGFGFYQMAGHMKPRWNKTGMVCLLLTLIWAGVIFSFSMQPAAASSKVSTGFGRWLAETFFPWFADRLDTMPQEQFEFFHHLLRKCGHFSEYLVLGVLGTLTVLQTNLRYRKITAASFCVLVALVDETIQLSVSGRSGQISDVVLDSLGAMTGIALVIMLVLLAKKKTL